jgi:peptidyl-tRNA hydrolase ICT1
MLRRPNVSQSLFSMQQLLGRPLVLARGTQHQAFDAHFDQDELAEARQWRASFSESTLPEGQTSYSRSSGPGGQHVNK